MKEKHTFVICAYGESPYLEECICSLLNQKRKSPVLIATSTPNEHIERLAEKYHLQVKVNQGKRGFPQTGTSPAPVRIRPMLRWPIRMISMSRITARTSWLF